MKIVVDAMGGDNAPGEIVLGALQAASEFPYEIILVGDQAQITKLLPANYPKNKISIVHAEENISMDEDPAAAIRRKKNCSINVGVRLVKEKKADAFLSAGNTGACMAGALLGLGRIKGIERPAIVNVWPSKKGKVVILDVGANSDCKPEYLAQFGLMGSIFSEKYLGVQKPRVALLSIGEEDAKGNELTTSSLPLLRAQPINVIGNIEGKNIFDDIADVIVCDGFVGNVVLKFAQGLMTYFMDSFKTEIKKSPLSILGALLMKPVFNSIRKRADYSEYGGAPLLGVDGVCIITHGRAKAKAIKNAVKAAAHFVEADITRTIENALAK